MKLPSEEKLKRTAEKRGWSIARANGYLEGETHRRHGVLPSTYALVGMNDYCLGFRAGYFMRDKQSARAALLSIDMQLGCGKSHRQ
jgi:hypothetical protein